MHLAFNSRNLEEAAQMLEADLADAIITPRETLALVRIVDAASLKLLQSAYYHPEEPIEEPSALETAINKLLLEGSNGEG